MITERAQVTALQGHQAHLKVLRHTTCSGCQQNESCATQSFSKLFPKNTVELWVDNPLHAVVGDQVLLGLDEAALLKASVQVYVWPLLGLFGALVLGQVGGLAQAYEPLVGISGLCLGFALQRCVPSAIKQPKMLRLVKPSNAIGREERPSNH